MADLAARWTVFRDDGLRLEVESLPELCQRIRSGELAANDELTRTGGNERRRLGSIEELRESFDHARTQRKPRPFAANEESARERTLAPPRRNSTIPPPLLEAGPAAARPRAPVPHVPHEPAYDPTLRPGEDLDRPSSRPPPRSSLPPPAIPVVRAPTVDPELSSAPRASSPARPVLSLALDDEPRRPAKKSYLLTLGLAVTLIGAVAVVAVAFRQRTEARRVERESALTAALLPMHADTEAAYRDACTSLGEQHRRSPDDAGIVASVAMCHSRWAQMLLDAAHFDRDAGRSTVLDALAREHADEAGRFSEHALELDADDPFARLSRADARRLANDLSSSESELRNIATTDRAASREALRVAAELDAVRTTYGQQSRASAERALAVATDDAQVIVLLARIAHTQRDTAALDDAIARLRQASPSHRGLVYLEAARSELTADAGVAAP